MQVSAHRPRGDDSRVILHFRSPTSSTTNPAPKDYDSFYAAVHEVANPALRTLPLAVQQKQIVVTCNYEARRRGLFKLQLITEARRAVPDLVIVSGEELDRYRDASKANFAFLSGFVEAWGSRAERLGLDEVWLDASELVGWNLQRLRREARASPGETAWFAFDRNDASRGFTFDPRHFVGHVWPSEGRAAAEARTAPSLLDGHGSDADSRLLLGSHLAAHMRGALEENYGYTASAGVSVNKLLAKLVGGVHKPRAQMTLLGPYFTGVEAPDSDTPHTNGAATTEKSKSSEALGRTESDVDEVDEKTDGEDMDALQSGFPYDSAPRWMDEGWEDGFSGDEMEFDDSSLSDARGSCNDNSAVPHLPPTASSTTDYDTALAFVSSHELGKVPGIGFKTSQALRAFAQPDPPSSTAPAPTPPPRLTAGALRRMPGMGPAQLTTILARRGGAHDAGPHTWALLHGIDPSPVARARVIPLQISLEDSFPRLDGLADLRVQLRRLAARLVQRMRADLCPGTEQSVSAGMNARTGGATAAAPLDTSSSASKAWSAVPHTLRLSTSARRGTPEGRRRASRQTPMPAFALGPGSPEEIADRLVAAALLPMFRALHPRPGWDVAVVNVAATNIAERGARGGADIRGLLGMGRWPAASGGQEEKADVADVGGSSVAGGEAVESEARAGGHTAAGTGIAEHTGSSVVALMPVRGSEDLVCSQGSAADGEAEHDDGEWIAARAACEICGAEMPAYAREAHGRFHANPD